MMTLYIEKVKIWPGDTESVSPIPHRQTLKVRATQLLKSIRVELSYRNIKMSVQFCFEQCNSFHVSKTLNQTKIKQKQILYFHEIK